MKNNNRNSICQQLAADFERRIRHKQLPPGFRMPSLKEICRMHHISYRTAFRIYDELAHKGILYSINGKGYFVASNVKAEMPGDTLSPITEIVMFGDEDASRKDTQLAGAMAAAEKAGVPLRIISSLSESFKLTESTGVILRYSASIMRIYQKLEFRRSRVVMTNNYFPEFHCVIYDNPDAMKQIIDRMTQVCGCRRLICCGRHFTDLGQANLNEREYAFAAECERRGLEYRSLLSGDVQELYQCCREPETRPDGIVFLSNVAMYAFDEERKNDPALQNIHCTYFSSSSNQTPLDNAFTFSSRDLGRMAVELLLNNRDEDWLLPNVLRVKGYWEDHNG